PVTRPERLGGIQRPVPHPIPSPLEQPQRSPMSITLPSFPNPVDEVSARLVAGGVLLLATSFVVTGWTPLVVVLAYGFVARVLAGPRLSPLGLLVTRGLRPRLPLAPRPVPGPPKRFAQAIGALLST